MQCLWLQTLLWIYCPGHAGVCGNEQAYGLANTADITSGLNLQLGTVEMLRGLRNFLNIDWAQHHNIDHLKERGVEKRPVIIQTDIGNVSRATLGRLLRDGVEHVWAFPSTVMPS